MRRPNIDLKGFMLISGMLLLFWFFMAPDFSLRNVVLGIFSAVGVTYYWRSDLFNPDKSMAFSLKQLMLLCAYVFHLAYNVIIANISVAKIVLTRDMPLSPGFIIVRTKLTHDLIRLIYANSITLTPGTITINLHGDRLLIHAITDSAACDVASWYMQDKLEQIEVNGK